MLNVTPVAIYDDNYVWIIEHNDKVLAVDPGDHGPVIEYLKNNNLTLDYLLITHKHWDHVTGIEALKQTYPACQVYGTALEPVPGLDFPLQGGEQLELLGLNWQVIHTPGHTHGQIAFYVQDETGQGYLFSADNLFLCGCGRMFEGTPEQFQASLATLMDFPANTLVYGTHEYSLANIDFALHIEPNNTYTLHRQDVCQDLRQQGLPTLPTTLADERKSNPFVRWDQPDVIRAAEQFSGQKLNSPAAVFGVVRKMKDQYPVKSR